MATRDGRRTGGRRGQGSKPPPQERDETETGAEAAAEPPARDDEWARKATEAATAAIEEARRRAGETARAAGRQAGTRNAAGRQAGPHNTADFAALAFTRYQSVLAEATTFAQQMAQTTFAAWRDFAGARGPAELLDVQTRLVRAQTEQVMEFTQRIAELMTRTDGSAPERGTGEGTGGEGTGGEGGGRR